MKKKYFALVNGAGLTGAVIAERLASVGKRVLLTESRDHIGGNVYDYVDDDTGVLVNAYGPHIFHTNSEIVWKYVNRFARFRDYSHLVNALVHLPNSHSIRTVNLPLNLRSFVDLFANTPHEAFLRNTLPQMKLPEKLTLRELKRLVSDEADVEHVPHYRKLRNTRFREVMADVIEYVEDEIYRPYTQAMWGADVPYEELEIPLGRIPLRFDYRAEHFLDKYKGQPVGGFTKMVARMIDNDLIDVEKNMNGLFYRRNAVMEFEHFVHTGPIDDFWDFYDHDLDQLQWRKMVFDFQSHSKHYLPYATLNTPSTFGDTLRTTDMSWINPSDSDRTVVISERPAAAEYPKSGYRHWECMYPIPTKANRELYRKYTEIDVPMGYEVHFMGRQGKYQYLEMGQAIGAALSFCSGTFGINVADCVRAQHGRQ